MRICAYCSAECGEEIRVKVNAGEDLCFCSRDCARKVYHSLGDLLMEMAPIKVPETEY